MPDLEAVLARFAEIGFKPLAPPAPLREGIERGHLVATVKDRDSNAVELLQ